MAIQFSYTDKFGHVDAAAYARLTFNAFDRVNNNGRVVMSIYRDAAARAADPVGNVMATKEFPVCNRPAFGEEEATTELDDLIDAIDADGLTAIYTYVKTKDADLNGGTDLL